MIQMGMHAVISIIVYLICIALSFQAVKRLKIDKFVRQGRVFEEQILLLFIAIALGYIVGNFFIALIDNSLQLSNFF